MEEQDEEISEEPTDELDLENIKIPEDNSEELENIIDETPTSFGAQTQEQTPSPFLEQEPITEEPVENLEQDLQNTPIQTENQEEQPTLYNAPQYTSDYDSDAYQESRRQQDTQIDISRGALMKRESEIQRFQPTQQRAINFNAWQQANTEQFRGQQEKYQIRQPKRIKEETGLPFQQEKKLKRI